jgi:hypothetical protein
MLGNKHLHIDPADQLSDWLGKAMRSARRGTIAIDFEGKPAARITADNGSIAVNLLEPAAFKISEDETGLFDKLKTASELASRLSDNSVTVSFLRKDKEVVRLGKGAHPTLSKLVTRSDDVQMSSVREFRKLKKDLKAG